MVLEVTPLIANQQISLVLRVLAVAFEIVAFWAKFQDHSVLARSPSNESVTIVSAKQQQFSPKLQLGLVVL